MARMAKGWKKELRRRAENEFGEDYEKCTTRFMMDEVVMSKHNIFIRHSRYFKGVGITFQVVGKFFEYNNERFFLNEGIVRIFPNFMNKINKADIKEMVDEAYKYFEEEITPENFYADGRYKTKLVAKDTGLITIRSKKVTSRIDAVFGFKNQIYPKIRNKEITTPIQLFEEYLRMFRKLGFKIINPEYPLEIHSNIKVKN